MPEPVIRPYTSSDERGWLECRVLAFLDTAYFDDVKREKERFDYPAIELVAEKNDEIVGLIDVECEERPETVCSGAGALGAVIWSIAVHPAHRRQGIATQLLTAAEEAAKARGTVRLQAWTRDDLWVQRWYETVGFELISSYLHVFVQGESEHKGVFAGELVGLEAIRTFAHYEGPDPKRIKQSFERVHECRLYERRLA